MTMNGEMAGILRYYTEDVRFVKPVASNWLKLNQTYTVWDREM